MGGLPVEGFLSLSSKLWTSTLKSKESQIVCAFCLELTPHEHNVLGTIKVSKDGCTVSLALQPREDSFLAEENLAGVVTSEDISTENYLEEDSENYFGDGDWKDVLVCSNEEVQLACPQRVNNIHENEENEGGDHGFVDYDLTPILVCEDTYVGKVGSRKRKQPVNCRGANTSSKRVETTKAVGSVVQGRVRPNKRKQQVKPKGSVTSLEPVDGKLEPIPLLRQEISQILCELCGKVFESQKNLKKHLSTHSADRPFPCEVCTKSFKCKSALRTHKSAIHGIGLQSHVCELCGISLLTVSHLSYHKRAKHGTSNLTCPHCSREFKVQSSYNRHVKLHFGIRNAPVQCTECGLMFARPDILRAHMKTHESGMSHTCDTCGETFTSYKKLRAHAQSHRFIRVFEQSVISGQAVA